MRRSFQLGLLPATLGLAFYSLGEQRVRQETKALKTFLWGNGVYQARPDATMNFSNFKPKVIENWRKAEEDVQMVQLAFGEVYDGGVDTKGRLVISRKHFTDSAQPSPLDSKRPDWKVLESDSAMAQVAFTSGFVWGLTKDGKVLQWKTEKHLSPQETEFKVGQKREVASLKEHEVTQLAAGEDHLLLLTKEGKVISMGDDTYGQCGIGASVEKLQRQSMAPFIQNRVTSPYLVTLPGQVQSVACGANHSLAVMQDGSVYGWGSNSHLQLSHQKEYAKASEPLMAIYRPQCLSLLRERDVKVTMAAAGDKMSVFVGVHSSGETEVFASGDNMRGQLGVGYTRHVQDLTLLEDLSHFKTGDKRDVTVDMLQCGRNHCVGLLSVGAVVQWGDNEHGQLGNGKRTYLTSPKIMGVFRKETVQSVWAGQNSTGAIGIDS